MTAPQWTVLLGVMLVIGAGACLGPQVGQDSGRRDLPENLPGDLSDEAHETSSGPDDTPMDLSGADHPESDPFPGDPLEVPDPAFPPDTDAPDDASDATGRLCCLSDLQCHDGLRCVSVPGDGGVCLPPPGPGSCWSSRDCDRDQVCQGAIPCRCGQDTSMDGCDIPGRCVPRTSGCCRTSGDCPAFQVCGPGNSCVPAPAPGECWTDDDCYGTQQCTGPAACPCEGPCALLLEAPGRCLPLPGGCCGADRDCPEGQVCRHQDSWDHLPGRCVPAPTGPACPGDSACCWEDRDCPDGSFCSGAVGCGCVELCPVCGACAPDQIGTCEPYPITVTLTVAKPVCRPPRPGDFFPTWEVPLTWHTSIPARSVLEVAQNAFTGREGQIPVEEDLTQDHEMVLALTVFHVFESPKVGESVLFRARVTGAGGQQGLSAAVALPVDPETRACLYPFDGTCSDGGPILCVPIPPPCDPGKVMAAMDGCERCVFPNTCTCDDGTAPACPMPPPTCDPPRILAVQQHCWACVFPDTCNDRVRW